MRLEDFADKLKASAYEGAKPDSAEGRTVADMRQDIVAVMESLYAAALVDASENYNAGAQKNTAESGDVKYSFKGYAEDGKGIYESNFPKGTPRKAKGERILRYIQDVWSLRIVQDGNVRYVEAQFDSTYSEDKNIRTDASKLMGGNRHGNAVEQRAKLDFSGRHEGVSGGYRTVDYFLTIFMVIVAFYFGTQSAKKADAKESTADSYTDPQQGQVVADRTEGATNSANTADAQNIHPPDSETTATVGLEY